ncbi:dicarboxylate/amino acid:cation symporter [Altererythrobacter sp. FM1]|uniref:dicarboxylate/amino acid:cation symporter n=1 Tax=Tsuneonella flava TaxID=2055955 RepID=UPI000C801B5F|nr:dicarboxylate/amino acid:cation symporter [Tsuneonella flava]ROT97033.1 dicarboxylate/amino acid:cation symporter [Altererythrobacter sp. FM1]
MANAGYGPSGQDTSRSALQRYWFDIPLWKRIVPAFVAGVAAGLIWGEDAVRLQLLGDIFVRLARMLVAPLIFFTITAGVIGVGDPKRLGSLGVRALSLFAASALVAATLGMAIGLMLQPGDGVSLVGARPQTIAAGRTLSEQLLSIIPVNPVQALADGDMLAIIFFAIFFAVGILTLGERGQPLANVIGLASEAMMRLVVFVMEVAPIGMFGLMAAAVGAHGLGVFVNISLLALGTLLGCVLQLLIVHVGLIALLARLSPLPYLRGAIDALVIAFSTSSSSASLPVELAIAEEKFGIHKSIASTVLPVGVGIARDGTAMFVALLSMFAIQALGIAPSLGDLMLVVAVSTLLALGAPPVPSAAMFMMAAVLIVVGVSDVESALIVGFILPFDRLLDMMRTTVNVSSNMVNVTVMAARLGEMERNVYAAGGQAPVDSSPGEHDLRL